MFTYDPPFFEDARGKASERLSKILGVTCEIRIHISGNETLYTIIKDIDGQMFRKDLQYNKNEIETFFSNKGFMAITIWRGIRPVAFFFGYDDAELSSSFYGDTIASTIEGKGIGSILFALVHVYCYEIGYSHFSCRTEKIDEKGRRLREWYKKMGLTHIKTDEQGDLMRIKLTPAHVSWIYKNFIIGESTIAKSV